MVCSPAVRGSSSGPSPRKEASNSAIQACAAWCAAMQVAPVALSLKTPNVFFPPGSNG